MKKYLKRVVKLVKLDEMQILPGHLAFHLIFLIIPTFSFIGFLASIYSTDFLNILSKNIPNAVVNIINGAKNINSYNIIIFLIISLWLSSKGCKAIIISSNILFKIKDQNNFKIQIKSFLMVIILFILISFVLIVPTLGNIIISNLSSNIINVVGKVYHIINYPLSIILMFFLIKLLYFMSPTKKIPSKYLNKGSLFTTITWLFLSRGYSYYLNNYINYNIYYGDIANLLILFLWIYMLSYLFTIGMALNADNYFVSKLVNKM